ncbi:cell division protein FtsL [Acinetobacter sp. DSM 11652]|uniref:cell division protein FtsL n=1 Tax=Acinetobacter sp. DSM 11652 TaxID=346222 RepID=UPI0008B37D45|nr:cell division protein FtsL [Acinetobacter sp. DSM 11652]SEL95025.1 cell division protein FtsL [Acinetobacter sp. DSM 11652]
MKKEKDVEQQELVATTLVRKKILIYSVLTAMVMVSAFMVVYQVYSYRQDFREFNTHMRELEDINAEWGRLLIEQQTFGATAQIGTRAVTQLRMYSPPTSQTVVISLPAETAKNQ